MLFRKPRDYPKQIDVNLLTYKHFKGYKQISKLISLYFFKSFLTKIYSLAIYSLLNQFIFHIDKCYSCRSLILI